MPDMTFRRLGSSGLVVSTIGLGTNNLGLKLDDDKSREVVHAALDSGITLFDTADNYGRSEERLGNLLKGHRDDVVLATKFGMDVRARGLDNGQDWGSRASRRYVVRAVEASLRRLQTDWIDLYQLHAPDPLTPIEETLGVLGDLVQAGKIRYIGHSNLTGWEVAHAHWKAETSNLPHFISTQDEYNLLNRRAEVDLLPALRAYGVGFLPFFPLASGLLTGKYKRDAAPPSGSRIADWGMESLLRPESFDIVERLEAFAERRGVSMLEVAIGGLAAQPGVSSVIAGATSAAQVRANAAAAGWAPTVADLAEIDTLTRR
jgi:aryl-alcohol dehydrogenase-like predicted oxidoreductase